MIEWNDLLARFSGERSWGAILIICKSLRIGFLGLDMAIESPCLTGEFRGGEESGTIPGGLAWGGKSGWAGRFIAFAMHDVPVGADEVLVHLGDIVDGATGRKVLGIEGDFDGGAQIFIGSDIDLGAVGMVGHDLEGREELAATDGKKAAEEEELTGTE